MPAREPAAHPGYAKLFARPIDRVVCAFGEDGDGRILFPLLLRPLAKEPWAKAGEDRWDATTPYGYGGPFAWGARDDAAYWREFEAFCRRERVVSTFARLSLFPDQLASTSVPPEPRQPNIVIPLAGGADAIRAGYDRGVRKAVKSAEEKGLRVVADPTGERLDDFYRIYTHTMERRGATDWYFFPREFFAALVSALPGLFVFAHVLLEDKVVASSLELCSNDYLYAFLGGTLAEAFDLGPNYLLKHASALRASAEGKKGFVLGGGHVPGDGIWRYKRGYAKAGEVPFHVLCLTHDAAAAADLAAVRAAHEAKAGPGWKPREGFFPDYRS